MSLFPSAVDRLFHRFCRSGDPAALGAVFDRTAPELLRVACYLVGNRTDAEDLVQRTFLAAIESRAAFGKGGKALPWLLGILGNHAHRLRRERARPAPLQAEPAADPTQQAAHRELEQRLRELRDELGAPYADVLQLHLEQGLNAKEIAERLSRPAGTVRTQLVRAMELLRQRLPDGFVAGSVLALAASSASAAAPALAAIRRVVVQAAQPGAVVAPAVSFVLIGSLLVSKKIVGVVLGVLFASLLGTWLAWPEAATHAPGSAEAGARVASAPQPATADPVAATLPSAAPTERIAASRAPAAAEAGFALVRVRALWSDRSPAAGVGVFASNGRSITQRDAVTDAEGFADLAHLVPGDWQIAATLSTNDGISQTEATVFTLASGEVREIEVSVGRLGIAKGRVVDAQDQPVADARIWMGVDAMGLQGHEVTHSDARGEFTVPFLASHSVGARKAGYAPSHTVSINPLEHAPFVLRLLHPGGTVLGTVRDPQGQPIAWAKLLIGHDLPHWQGLTKGEILPRGIEALTGSDGTFRVDGVPAGLIEMQVGADGFAPWIGGIDVTAGGQSQRDVVLQRGGSVRGIARDGAGKPIAGAKITWSAPNFFLSAATTTAADGSYLLDSLAPGEQTLVAHRGGVRTEATLAMAAGVTTTWDPVLGSDHSVRGRIVDADGKGLEGYEVAAFGKVEPRGHALSGPDGAFQLERVGDEPLRLEVARGFDVLLRRDNIAPGSDDVLLQIDAMHMPSAVLTGRLLDEDGRPVGAVVVPWHRDSSQARHQPSDGKTGIYRIGPVRPGHYTLVVDSERFGRVTIGEHDLAPNQTLDLGDFVLKAPGAAEFTVTIAGRPAAGGLVFLRRPDGDWTETLTIEHGKAKHSALPAGPLLVTAEYQGGVQSTEVTITPGATAHATLDLQRPFRATVTLLDPRNQTREVMAPRARAEREDGSFAGLFAAVGLPGAPQLFVELPPGVYTLRVTTADGRKADAHVDLRAGHTQQSIQLPQ